MSKENNIAKTLTKAGTVGVMIALILLAGYSIWNNNNLVGNHIEHNTNAILKQAESNIESAKMISKSITESAEATTELSTLIRLLR